jgi:hypothetical protein
MYSVWFSLTHEGKTKRVVLDHTHPLNFIPQIGSHFKLATLPLPLIVNGVQHYLYDNVDTCSVHLSMEHNGRLADLDAVVRQLQHPQSSKDGWPWRLVLTESLVDIVI